MLAALTSVLYLGGWAGPWSDQVGGLWMLLKIFALGFLVIWARVAYPRLREDQLNALAWKVLVPLALGAPALIGGAVALVAGLGVFAVKLLKGRKTS